MLFLAEKNEGQNVGLSRDVRDLIANIIGALQTKYGYSENGAMTSLQYLLRMRYDTQK